MLNLFKKQSAWFSTSVEKRKREIWVKHGGTLTDREIALFVFSEDADAPDTKWIFSSPAYSYDSVAVFHASYVDACYKEGSMAKVEKGTYYLPPTELHEVVRQQGGLRWEKELAATNSRNQTNVTAESNQGRNTRSMVAGSSTAVSTSNTAGTARVIGTSNTTSTSRVDGTSNSTAGTSNTAGTTRVTGTSNSAVNPHTAGTSTVAGTSNTAGTTRVNGTSNSAINPHTSGTSTVAGTSNTADTSASSSSKAAGTSDAPVTTNVPDTSMATAIPKPACSSNVQSTSTVDSANVADASNVISMTVGPSNTSGTSRDAGTSDTAGVSNYVDTSDAAIQSGKDSQLAPETSQRDSTSLSKKRSRPEDMESNSVCIGVHQFYSTSATGLPHVNDLPAVDGPLEDFTLGEKGFIVKHSVI
ncbi:uncharacterized protein LOC144443660 [Glandiceps talaboti]